MSEAGNCVYNSTPMDQTKYPYKVNPRNSLVVQWFVRDYTAEVRKLRSHKPHGVLQQKKEKEWSPNQNF